MATIITRAGKGSPLENAELDANFTNLNDDKLEAGDNLGTPSGVVLTNATGLPTSGLLDNAVTDAKLRDSAALSVIGRASTGTGNPADIEAGANGTVLRRSGSSIGFGAIDLGSNQAVSGTLPVNQGGTGSTTAAGALTNFGLTATAAEINTLDGITATVTELNYTDGVTSNIQTQLNTKAPLASPTFTGTVTADGLSLGDNDKATFGNSNDLQIYHDGSNSIIYEGGTGDLQLRGNGGSTTIMNGGGTETLANFGNNGAVTLYHDNAEKLATTATGIDVTGTATMDGLNVSTGIYNINTSGASLISSTGSVKIDIDSDNNATDNRFLITSDGNTKNRLEVGESGDISFYEDTGTTPKFFWDASAESLGIGTSTVNADLHLGAASPHIDIGPSAGNRGKVGFDSNNVYIGSTSGTGEIHFKNNIGSTDAPHSSGDTKMVITDSGVGIGTTPNAWLSTFRALQLGQGSSLWGAATGNNAGFDSNAYVNTSGGSVYVGSASATRYQQSSGQHRWFIAPSGTAGNTISFTQAMTLDSNGNVGIGNTVASTINTANGVGNLVVGSGSGSEGITIYTGTTGIGGLAFADGTTTTDTYRGYLKYAHSADEMSLWTAATQRLTIDSNGQVGIGNAAPQYQLDLNTTGSNTLFGAGISTSGSPLNLNLSSWGQSGGRSGIITFTTGSATNGSERMRIDASGNVGIGSASPGCKVDIVAADNTSLSPTLRVNSNNVAVNAALAYDGLVGSGEFELRTSSAAALKFGTNNTERLRIDSSGNVGIGTSSPAFLLDISGANNSQLRIVGTDTNPTTILMDYNSTGSTDRIRIQNDAGDMKFTTSNGQVRQTITKTGLVGIGTSSPSYALDVVGQANITSGARFGSTTNSLVGDFGSNDLRAFANNNIVFATGGLTTGDEVMRIDSSGNVGIGTSSPSSYNAVADNLVIGTTSGSNGLTIVAGTGNDSSIHFADGTSGADAYRGQIYYSHAGNYMVFGTNATERMRIDSGGNVGIGTNSPSSSLTIREESANHEIIEISRPASDVGALYLGTVGTNDAAISANNSNLTFGIAASGVYAEKMRIDSSGNVGIGTDSPYLFSTVQAGLTLSGTSSSFATRAGALTFQSQDTTSTLCHIHARDGYMAFSTGTSATSTQRMRIDSSGNVGIGTSSPTEALTVVNGTNTTVAQFGGTAGGGDPRGLTISTFSSAGGGDCGVDFNAAVNNTGYGAFTFSAATNERMRIDSSGNVYIGKTTDSSTTAGIYLSPVGKITTTRSSGPAAAFVRISSDGSIVDFQKDGTTVGSILNDGTAAYFNSTADGGLARAGTVYFKWSSAQFYPNVDDSSDLGIVSRRFDDVYATNGTIQTSDRNEKQDIEELSNAETRVAVAAKGLLRKFRWKSAVEEKGEDARIHFGIIAQDLQAAFEAEGLDAGRYAMFIHSTWTDEETGEERSRMGVRYSELLAFIIAAL